MRFAILLALALLFVACAATVDQAEDVDNTAEEHTMITTDTGLQYEILVEGEGAEAKLGDTCVVHYTGWLMDDTKFDSSHDRNQPFPVTLGQHRVIRGWEEGLQGMKVGEKRLLVIPPDLAYGSRGAGRVIPPNATIKFEVELLEIK